jgi:hypothetical protein
MNSDYMLTKLFLKVLDDMGRHCSGELEVLGLALRALRVPACSLEVFIALLAPVFLKSYPFRVDLGGDRAADGTHGRASPFLDSL